MTYIGCYNSTGTHPHSLRPPHGTQVRKHNYSPLSKCLLLVFTIVILEYLNFVNTVRAWYPIYWGFAGRGRCIGCVPFTGGGGHSSVTQGTAISALFTDYSHKYV